MTQFYGITKLDRVEDWEAIVSSKNWVPTRSAYELAHHWHAARGFPAPINKAFNAAKEPFPSLRIRYGLVEMFVLLDTLKAPSRTDLMLYCDTPKGEPVVIAVEAKATEEFGLPIGKWIRNGKTAEKPSRVKRLRFLGELIGRDFPTTSPLRYQLLHRTASAISESLLHGASECAVVVHSFADCPENWLDFQAFTRAIGIAEIEPGTVSNPVALGPEKKVRTRFLWVHDQSVKITNRTQEYGLNLPVLPSTGRPQKIHVVVDRPSKETKPQKMQVVPETSLYL